MSLSNESTGNKPLEGGDESLAYPRKYDSFYAQTKAIAEQSVLSHPGNFQRVALRPHLIWGPGDPHILPRLVERSEYLSNLPLYKVNIS